MLIEEKTFQLKDGRTALIRSPRDEDIPGTLAYLYETAGETDFLLRYPEECAAKYTPEGEKTLFDRVNASPNEVMPVCLVDGEIAGNCMLSWPVGIKTRHRASVAIAVKKEYWGLGIGTKLMEEMISVAESVPEILQIELEYIEGNARARRLYEKMGFRITGVRPDAIRLKDGTLLNEYSMMRKLAL